MEEMTNAYKFLVGNHEGNRPFGKSRHRWEGINRKFLRETGWEVVDWIPVAQDRNCWWAFVNRVMNLWVP
jgi:hypothetical protein